MPIITSTIDVEREIIFTCVCGTLTHADLKGHGESLLADSRVTPDFRQLADFTRVTAMMLSMGELRQIVDRTRMFLRGRRALVMPVDAQFGMGRAYQSLLEVRGNPDLLVCRTLSEAAAWLPVDLRSAKVELERLAADA
jgi:hypothetical protein